MTVNRRGRTATGFTLAEMMVSMMVLMVFMAVFATSSLAIMDSTVAAASTADAASDQNSALDIISAAVSPASAVNQPGSDSSGDMFVEALIPAYAATPDSAGRTYAQCVQVKYSAADKAVMMRRWQDGAVTSASALPGWSRLSMKAVVKADDMFSVDASGRRKIVTFKWNEMDKGFAAVGQRRVVALNSTGSDTAQVCMPGGSAARS